MDQREEIERGGRSYEVRRNILVAVCTDNKQVGQPTFSRVMIKGIPYYRTRIKDADGKRVSLYARTEKELVVKLAMARGVIEDAKFRKYNKPEQLSAVVNEALEK